MHRCFIIVFLALSTMGCHPGRARESLCPEPRRASTDPLDRIVEAAPEDVGLDTGTLLQLAQSIRDSDVPLFSLLISRDGRLVYELYTSSLQRDDAHYVMSVTKSVLSALVGIAIDRGLLTGADEPVADALPPSLFGTESARTRFLGLTLRDVLGMSALDAEDPPHSLTAEARARGRALWSADDRVRFALTQPIIASPGTSFQYNDSTPLIAAGAVEYATGETLLRFAQQTLFGPMHFRNVEWQHQDAHGNDNGAYGLRLRPIDMQKFGLLYLRHGDWNGRHLVSAAWVDQSLTPWNHSPWSNGEPDYGWFWWSRTYRPGWTGHAARGWKGQRIVVFREQRIVLTMTGDFEDGGEEEAVERLVDRFLAPAVERGETSGNRRQDPGTAAQLAQVLAEVQRGRLRVGPSVEWRMIPGRTPREEHRDVAFRR